MLREVKKIINENKHKNKNKQKTNKNKNKNKTKKKQMKIKMKIKDMKVQKWKKNPLIRQHQKRRVNQEKDPKKRILS